MDLPKTYRADICLGLATDTYDATGQPTFVGDPSSVGEDQIRAALPAFVGEVEQVPPPYSAVKRRGRPAYAYARAGRPLALTPRRVEVYRIELKAYQPPFLSLEVECGKGTYIRSLAYDLGQRLGCGAHLHRLIRWRVGPFAIEEAHLWTEVEEALVSGRWAELLLPLDYGLGHLPPVTLGLEEERDVRHGCSLPVSSRPVARLGRAVPGQRCRAYAEDGGFIGLLRFDGDGALWRPEKVFNTVKQGH
jgi:tRNA pseudouridine55 synthase